MSVNEIQALAQRFADALSSRFPQRPTLAILPHGGLLPYQPDHYDRARNAASIIFNRIQDIALVLRPEDIGLLVELRFAGPRRTRGSSTKHRHLCTADCRPAYDPGDDRDSRPGSAGSGSPRSSRASGWPRRYSILAGPAHCLRSHPAGAVGTFI